jgi:hypothetical protein
MNILKLNNIFRSKLIIGLLLMVMGFLLLCIDGCCPVLPEVEVFFDSKPAGASLWIEGQYMGYQTPVTLPLYPGKYSVTLKKDAYRDWQEEVQVKNMEEQEILAELVGARKQEITIRLDENHGQDASVLAFHPYGNYGQEKTLGVGSNLNPYQNLIYRSYLQFDLEKIPQGARLLEAKLGLFFNSDGKPEQPSDIHIYPVLEEWQEDSITWDSQPEVAHESRSFTTVPASLTMDFVWWDITCIADDWHNHLADNNGIVLKDPEEESIDGGKGFASSESEIDSIHPRLIVKYYLP